METHVHLSTLRKFSLPLAVIGLVACAFGITHHREQLAVSWLMGWTFWFYVSLGSLGWLMIYHLTSGRWGFVLQRPFEAAARLIPIMGLLFIPVALSVGALYSWADPEVIATDKIVQHKLSYLNEQGYLTRAVIYFAVWSVLAFVMSGLSRAPGADGNPDTVKRLRQVAAPGLVVFALAATFASFDWMMSLEPHWFSSIYGAVYMVAAGLSAMLFMAVLMHHLGRRAPMQQVITTQQFHDIGNWCFAFSILWTYMNFSQFIIVWSGNLYEETFWYLQRAKGGWVEVSILMSVVLFAVPLLLLLFKANKRNSARLAVIALVIFIARILEVYWLIGPTFRTEALALHWLDAAAFIGIGGLWLWLFAGGLAQEPLLSGDARFTEFAKGNADKH